MNAFRLAVLASAFLAGPALGADCPTNYPADFPCIAGGASAGLPLLQRSSSGPKEVISLTYRQDPLSLFNTILARSEAQGWTIGTRSEGREGGGLRYRAGFEKGKAGWSIVVFGSPDKATLQLTKW